jgi:lysozyme family protein
MHWLTPDELLEAERYARRFSGSWTGTSGTLASFTVHLVRMVRKLQEAPMTFDTSSPAQQLLAKASATIEDRRATYGPPAEHFAKTVAAVNAIFSHKLREPLTVADWAQVMILDKLARHQGNGGQSKSADTPVDLAGYAACLAEVEASGA